MKTTRSGKPSPLISATAIPAHAFSYENQSGTAVKSVFINWQAARLARHRKFACNSPLDNKILAMRLER